MSKVEGGREVSRILTLCARATLLQNVHFDRFMDGYEMYVSPRGEVCTTMALKSAVFQVRKSGVSFVSNIDQALLDGKVVPQGVAIPLQGNVSIRLGESRLEYRDLRGVDAPEDWPYMAEIRRPPIMNFVKFGGPIRIGRSPTCEIELSNSPGTENIVWKPEIGSGDVIHTSTGDIPKARFYTDSVMVASEHACITPSVDEGLGDAEGAVRAACIARSCYVFVRRGDQLITLFPTASGRKPTETQLQSRDELLIGNTVFQVSWGASIDTPARPSGSGGAGEGAFPTIGTPRTLK